jgi:hypothetical protein
MDERAREPNGTAGAPGVCLGAAAPAVPRTRISTREQTMIDAKTAGRTFAAMMLAQMVLAPVANFALVAPAIAPPGFLANAAGHAGNLTGAALVLLVMGALWVGLAAAAFPVFARHNMALAAAYVALGAVCFLGLAFEGFTLRAMLSLSRELATSGADPGPFQAPAVLARSMWASAHFTNFVFAGVSHAVLYTTMLCYRLAPRLLCLFGLLTVPATLAGAVIPLVLRTTADQLYLPTGICQLLLVIWLAAKGFADVRDRP